MATCIDKCLGIFIGLCIITGLAFLVYGFITTRGLTKQRAYRSLANKRHDVKFFAGTGGQSKNGMYQNNIDNKFGGGGAGGVVITSSIFNVPKIKAGDGIFGLDGKPPSGLGGEGFGAGGGGAGLWKDGSYYLCGGNGAQGFVYVVEDKRLITLTTDYEAVGDSYQFILMGGGGAGGLGSYTNPLFAGNGGCSGHITITPPIKTYKGQKFKIVIGNGGVCVQNQDKPLLSKSNNGEDTKIVENGKLIAIAKGGLSGNNKSSTSLKKNCGSAMGGLNSIIGYGGKISDNLIKKLNTIAN